MELKEVYTKTAELIEAGWCRRSFRKLIGGQPHYCALGALEKVAGYGDLRYKAMVGLAEHISTKKPKDAGLAVVRWNDSSLSKNRVVKAFRTLAKEEDE